MARTGHASPFFLPLILILVLLALSPSHATSDTYTPTATATSTVTATPAGSGTPVPTASPSDSPTPTDSPEATGTPLPTSTTTSTVTATPSPTDTPAGTGTTVPTRSATSNPTPTRSVTATESKTVPPTFRPLDIDVYLSPNVTNATAGFQEVEVWVIMHYPGDHFISNGAELGFTADNPIQPPIYIDLSAEAGCHFNETSSPNMTSWHCPAYQLPVDRIIDGVTFTLVTMKLFEDSSVYKDHLNKLPRNGPITFTVYTPLLEFVDHDAVNVTLRATFTHFWSFLLGSEDGGVYYDTSDYNGTGWEYQPQEINGQAHAGTTGVCFSEKFAVALSGGLNYTTGEWGKGYIILGNTTHYNLAYSGGPGLSGISCKEIGLVTEVTPVKYVAVGRYNTIIYSLTGDEWVNASRPTIYSDWNGDGKDDYSIDMFPVHYHGVGCLNELQCVAMARREVGLYWETYILFSEDGGRAWDIRHTFIRERGVSLSCVDGTTTCYLSTEIYTGSNIYRTDDRGLSWTLTSRFDVLSAIKIFCYWADECIAGAGTWLGRWHFPSAVFFTKDAGSTWHQIYHGEIGELITDCRCGSVNNELCMCSINNRLVMWDMSQPLTDLPTPNQYPDSVDFVTHNETFDRLVGPLAEFQIYFAADVLRDLYFSTEGIHWLNKRNWLTGNPCKDDWYGVVCSGIDGSADDMQSLRLNANGLNGTLPASMGVFGHMETIEMNVNFIRGAIPSSFGRMTRLKRLSLYNNQLSGTLTRKLSQLTSLTHLALFSNEFTSALPSDWSLLLNMRWLYLYNNRFTGPIPTSFAAMTYLSSLNIRNNKFSGTLPAEMASLTLLRSLDLSDNQLHGAIPHQWGNLTRLTHFSVIRNLAVVNDDIFPPPPPLPWGG